MSKLWKLHYSDLDCQEVSRNGSCKSNMSSYNKVLRHNLNVLASSLTHCHEGEKFAAPVQAEVQRLKAVKADQRAINDVHRKQEQILEKAKEASRQLLSDKALKQGECKSLQKALRALEDQVYSPAFESLLVLHSARAIACPVDLGDP